MTSFEKSVVNAVRRMKYAGVKNKEIAEAVGLSEDQVKGLCNHRHIKLRTSDRIAFKVPAGLKKACTAEAGRRKITLNVLMRTMLLKIVEANLFSAIIDDGR